jgi:hypothetical protein
MWNRPFLSSACKGTPVTQRAERLERGKDGAVKLGGGGDVRDKKIFEIIKAWTFL